MNDYLNNLAARSLNPAPVLQPRLRSPFEPAPQYGLLNAAQPLPAAPDLAVFDATTEIESGSSPVESRRAPIRRANKSLALLPREAESIAPLTRKGESITPLARKGGSIPPLMYEDESIAPAPREAATMPAPKPPESAAIYTTAAPVKEISAPQLTIRPVEPARALPPASPAAPAVDRSARLDQPLAKTIEPKKAGAAIPSSPRKNDGEAQRPSRLPQMQTIIREQVLIKEAPGQSEIEPRAIQAPVAETKLQSHAPIRPSVLSPIVAQPRIAPLFENRNEDRFARDEQPPAPPAPAINVTIGRIEVRAVQSTSSSSPKPRPAQPAMSLDDYLRQRNGGVR